MDWNLIFTAISTLILGGILWGIMSTRVNYLEKLVEELRTEVKDFRRLSEDLAVVKHDINSIKSMLARIIQDVEGK
jgi:hypothetical protein